MSNTTSLPGSQATPLARLIVKAALAHGNANPRAAAARATLNAYAAVAADVLDACTAPAAFVLAIMEGVRAHPHPYTATVGVGSLDGPAKAAALRRTWQQEIVADVSARLN
jgi:hypothetical protein